MPANFGLAARLAILDWWNGLDASVREYLTTGLRGLENSISELAATETETGLACNISGPCSEGEPAGMALVPLTEADQALRAEAVKEAVLPAFAECCGSECVPAWNATIGGTLGIAIQYDSGAAGLLAAPFQASQPPRERARTRLSLKQAKLRQFRRGQQLGLKKSLRSISEIGLRDAWPRLLRLKKWVPPFLNFTSRPERTSNWIRWRGQGDYRRPGFLGSAPGASKGKCCPKAGRGQGWGNHQSVCGKLVDETVDKLTPSHASKKGKRYRYYASNRLLNTASKEDSHTKTGGRRLAAASQVA